MSDPFENMSIADRMYALVGLEDSLFCKVNEILGCDTEKCLDERFVWQCRDCYYDYYDNSIEVRRSAGLQWMTEEQANQMLALGFGIIWETVGEEAVMWSHGKGGKTTCQKCSPRPLEGIDKMTFWRESIIRFWLRNHLINT